MDSQEITSGRTVHPCAACRLLRRKCDRNCVLAPYFPSPGVEEFASVHRVFGASNVIKMIQMVEESKRDDAVKSITYEAAARLRDPVYGSVGTISHLQKMVRELEMQLQRTRAQVLMLQEQRDQLLAILKDTGIHHFELPTSIDDKEFEDSYLSSDDSAMAMIPSNSNTLDDIRN